MNMIPEATIWIQRCQFSCNCDIMTLQQDAWHRHPCHTSHGCGAKTNCQGFSALGTCTRQDISMIFSPSARPHAVSNQYTQTIITDLIHCDIGTWRVSWNLFIQFNIHTDIHPHAIKINMIVLSIGFCIINYVIGYKESAKVASIGTQDRTAQRMRCRCIMSSCSPRSRMQ